MGRLEDLQGVGNVVLTAAPSVFVLPGKPLLPGVFPPCGSAKAKAVETVADMG